MSFKMVKEFSFPLKLFGAFITFKLFLPSVCSHMGIHIALFVERFRAKRTFKWFFTCVYSLMVFQDLLCRKPLGAVLALIPMFTGVSQNVLIHLVFSGKGHWAVLALEWLFPSVDPFMEFQFGLGVK